MYYIIPTYLIIKFEYFILLNENRKKTDTGFG